MSLATIDLNAVSLLQRTVEEQQALASELARLIGALGDRYARLEQRLTDALAMSSDACKRAQDADVPPRANVTCFGSFGISVDGRPINDWRGGKSRPCSSISCCIVVNP